MYIPQKKYYKINHFKNYLLNYEGSEDISNYDNIINELDIKLGSCSKINQAILAFSIIVLILSIAIIFIIIIYIFYSRQYQKIYLDSYEEIIYAINLIRLFLSFIVWSMALAIIAKINKIRKKEDKIGLTNEIKRGIIKVIIILTFYLIYCIFEFCFICYYSKNCSQSLFLYNEYYIKNTLENKKINEDLKSSRTIVIPFKEREKSGQFEIDINELNDQVNQKDEKIKKLEQTNNNQNEEINKLKSENQKLKEKEKNINELNDQVNQKDEKIKKLEQANNTQNEEINLLKSENQKLIIEIKELESENPYKLKKNEKLIPIIFDSSDQKIHYSLICKNTQKFAFVEQELYDIFPEYKEEENFFLLNGNKINKSKTIEENNIKFSDHINIYKYDDFNGQ